MANRLSKECSVEGCDKKVWARGMCPKHYRRARVTGEIAKKEYPDTCSVDGCENPHFASGLCQIHYHRNYYHNTMKRASDIRNS